MTAPIDPVANGTPTVRAAVSVAGRPLAPQLDARLLRVVVDNDLHLPGMFELTFLDLDGTTLTLAGISIGTQVTVAGAATGTPSLASAMAGPLIVGEVTSIEGLLQGITTRTVVRGYTMAHRLQRARRSRTFLNSTDADIARQIVSQAGLTCGAIMPTTTTHAHLPQVNQTDWEFLAARAAEIGYEMGVENGVFHFRPAAPGAPTGGGIRGAVGGAVRGAVSNAVSGLLGASVKFPDTLISFRPRISAGNLTPDVEVRVWDPMERRAVAQLATAPTGTAPSPASMGGQFASGGLGAVAGALGSAASAAASGNIAGAASSLSGAASSASSAVSSMTGGLIGSPIGYLGPPPSTTAHVVNDRPLASGLTMATSGPAAAGALGSDLGSTYAEAEGDAVGNPAIQPGATVTVTGVPSVFAGQWKISRARHVFDDSEHGYRTTFAAHGRQDRSMLGLTTKATRGSSSHRATIDGVVCGVVSNCADPLGKGRVKVTLPWLAPDFETDWAPNVQFCSGQRSGAMFMPEIGDEVLLAFEFGDPRRPYVLGGMMNNFTQWSVAAAGPIAAGGLMGLASAGMGLAGAAGGAAIGGAVAGPLGGMVGAAIGSAVASQAMSSVAGSVMTPGMVSEVHHRGFVSSTGNALLFYDYPLPLPIQPPSTADVANAASAATGTSVGSSMGGTGATTSGTTGSILPPGAGALASAVRLGTQKGETGITIDQVNAGVSISAKIIPGVTMMPLPNVSIVADNGFVNLSAGSAGTMMIDGGTNLIIKASGVITLEAGTINLVGLPLINGVPIPI